MPATLTWVHRRARRLTLALFDFLFGNNLFYESFDSKYRQATVIITRFLNACLLMRHY